MLITSSLMDVGFCKSHIERKFPQLKVGNIQPLQQGWDSYAVEVNNEYVFRFATHPNVMTQYKKEAWLLPRLAKNLQLRVPDPLFIKLEPPPPLFIGYRFIPGTPLRSADITESTFKSYSDQLKSFLSSVSSFPIQDAQNEVPILNGDKWRQKYAEFNEEISIHLSTKIEGNILRNINEVFEEFLGEKNFNFQPKLIHNDLSSDHILHDETTGLLTGVIDWGDSVFGDPAFDLTGLLGDYGSGFCTSILQGVNGSESMLKRAGFYLRLIPFYKALHGLEVGDKGKLDEGLRLISREFSK